MPDELEIGFPPNPEMGHFAVGCFPLAKQFRRAPAEIAAHIAAQIEPDDRIAQADPAGPYINLKISENFLFGDVCDHILSRDSRYGATDIGQGKRAIVAYVDLHPVHQNRGGHRRQVGWKQGR